MNAFKSSSLCVDISFCSNPFHYFAPFVFFPWLKVKFFIRT